MHELAGIIVTPETADINKRMKKFCDLGGTGISGAFCDGWNPVYIDKHGDLHTSDADESNMQVYCESVVNYLVRNVSNPYAGILSDACDKYYPAELSMLVSEDDQVYSEDEVEAQLDFVRNEHPDWKIMVINYHC